MLRYYDQLGLLLPMQVDEFTGYRYYSASQIPRLNRILMLKEIGFSLNEIVLILDKNLSEEEMVTVLSNKREEIKKAVEKEQNKISRIESYVKLLKKEGNNMEYNIVLKSVPEFKVVGIRGVIPRYEDEGSLWEELRKYSEQENIKCAFPSYAIFYDEGFKEKDVEVEVMYAVSQLGKDTDKIKFRTLQAVEEMACIIHKGPYEALYNAYAVASRWMEENKYELAGPSRVSYLKGPWDGVSPEEWITEVQLPVVKKQ